MMPELIKELDEIVGLLKTYGDKADREAAFKLENLSGDLKRGQAVAHSINRASVAHKAVGCARLGIKPGANVPGDIWCGECPRVVQRSQDKICDIDATRLSELIKGPLRTLACMYAWTKENQA